MLAETANVVCLVLFEDVTEVELKAAFEQGAVRWIDAKAVLNKQGSTSLRKSVSLLIGGN